MATINITVVQTNTLFKSDAANGFFRYITTKNDIDQFLPKTFDVKIVRNYIWIYDVIKKREKIFFVRLWQVEYQ